MKRLAPWLILLTSIACGKSVEKQIRDQVRNFDNASLAQKQVEVKNVQEMGDHAVAEVQITTAVKMIKQDGKWLIEEFRIGDRRWERADHILELINEKRTATTLQQINQITDGIRRYTDLNSRIPQVSTFEELVDMLSPHFQNQVIRIDSWSNPFYYRARGDHQYTLRSLGPDGRLGTSDDLVADFR